MSVIVCTLNRFKSLDRALASIAAAHAETPGLGLELILVDNGSTDPTPHVAAAFARAVPFRVVLEHEPRRGLARARNSGLGRAMGDLLVFLDDDCELRPDYFRALLRAYAADTDLVVRGGRVELADAADQPVTIKLSERVEVLDAHTAPGGFIHGCNMIVPRAAARRIGAFDVAFGVGARFRSAEDTDYVVRAYLAGLRVEYSPHLVVRHRHGRRTEAAARETITGYAFGNGALYAKHLRAAPYMMRRHVRWTARSALREFVGGAPFEPGMGVSHWRILRANLGGVRAYLTAALKTRITRTPAPVSDGAGRAPATARLLRLDGADRR
ncbi:glycosyltransferase family 2 protein [Acuticoccus kandeliae]|uniref:glycosyltransferase family 2 protein n=1 Tax=Acuticoccus kandeliae TaxID=2073160 RepID=UPI00130045DF|nr:glycosyltransferase [Acuticoccus kandeliae]